MKNPDCPYLDPAFHKLMDTETPAKVAYASLNVQRSPRIESVEEKWCEEFGDEIDVASMCRCIKYITPVSKYHSFQYRMLMRALITNIQLERWKLIDSSCCTFCGKQEESVYHLFFECDKIQCVCHEVKEIAGKLFGNAPTITYRNVVMCTISDIPVVNLCSLVCKQYIYQKRCAKKPVCAKEFNRAFHQCKNIEKYYAVKECKMLKYLKRWRESEPNHDIYLQDLESFE